MYSDEELEKILKERLAGAIKTVKYYESRKRKKINPMWVRVKCFRGCQFESEYLNRIISLQFDYDKFSKEELFKIKNFVRNNMSEFLCWYGVIYTRFSRILTPKL